MSAASAEMITIIETRMGIISMESETWLGGNARYLAGTLAVNPFFFYYGMLVGTGIGGNITPVGATANVLACGMLEKRGVPPKLADLAQWWLDCCIRYPWNEYGFCARNLERGLMPPASGWFCECATTLRQM